MSTSDQPSPPLTRRQLRELRNTASTPVITPEEAEQAAAEAAAVEPEPAPSPRPAEPAAPPIPEDIDLDAPPVSRKHARLQAKLRTEAISVVSAPSTPDVAEDSKESDDAAPSDADATEAEIVEADGIEDSTGVDESADDERTEDESVEDAAVEDESADEPAREEQPAQKESADAASDIAEDSAGAHGDEVPADEAGDEEASDAEIDSEKEHVIAPALGAQLLAGESASPDLPPSFDHLLTRGGSAGGSASAPNALILSQSPDTGSLSVPILGTGELLITGSYALPETYGSTGSVPGSQDGKDVDAVLIDGELPPASSPTPIAASSAISTIKSADEIIRPPAPEKGSRLMMTLTITVGALALALATVLVLAVVNGVF